MKIAAWPERPGGDRADSDRAQLRSLRGAGVTVESVLEVSVVVDVAAGVVLLSVAFASAGVVADTAVSAGVVDVDIGVLAVVDDESVDCATAAPMPASSAAAAARADNFF